MQLRRATMVVSVAMQRIDRFALITISLGAAKHQQVALVQKADMFAFVVVVSNHMPTRMHTAMKRPSKASDYVANQQSIAVIMWSFWNFSVGQAA